jgi:hypothetical protein
MGSAGRAAEMRRAGSGTCVRLNHKPMKGRTVQLLLVVASTALAFPAFSKDVAAPAPQMIGPVAAPTAATAQASPTDTGTTASLMSELKSRDEEVATLVKSGSYGGIYVPALKGKDLALEIQARQDSSNQKQAIETQVKQLVVAAYELDNYGDLGDAEKISGAYRDFAAAVSALNSLLGTHP